jgi:VWFA-related protein
MRFFLILFLIFPPLIFAQTQEEVEVKTIQVWIKADRDGKPVAGLTANDFEIEEDGKKMESTCFEEFVLPSAEQAQSDESDETQMQENSVDGTFIGKRLAIFFDQYNTSEVEYQYMMKRLTEFLSQTNTKKLQVMLAAFPPYEKVVSFTEDVDEVLEEMDGLAGNLHRDQDMMFKRRQIINILEKRPFNNALLAAAVDTALQYQAEEIQMAKQTLAALDEFGSYLNALQQNDHTVMLLISGGLNIEPGRQYFDLVRAKTGDEEQGLPLGGLRGASWDLRRETKNTVSRLNLNNITIYTINTRGPISVVNEATEFQKKYLPKDNEYLRDHQEMMDIIADETGGISFKNSLNFKFGFNQVLNDLNHQYLVCYKAPEHKASGDYHEIKVKTKEKGIKLRHREGYID